MPGRTVGVIGLGIMGSAMAASLVGSGFSVRGFDVLAKRRAALKKSGGRPARSVRDLARQTPIIITSLPSAQALLDVSTDLAATRRAEQIVIETSTLPIAIKDEARKILAARGITLLDCPLSGTGAQARTKDIAVYASGPRAAYRQCVPVFEGFARANYFLGAFGTGSKMKFLANLLVAIHNVSAAEALVLGMKAGLDPKTMVKVLGDGAGSSRMLQVRGPMMAKGDYSNVTMKVAVWQKDMTIIGDFARALDCPTPLFSATASIYNAAMAQGFAEADTGSVCAVMERLAKVRRR
jgi:L-threonate 2-dehydrogenase